MYYVYVLVAHDESEYVGYTNDLRRRLVEHNEGTSRSTRGKTWHLVYYEAYRAEDDARRREKQLKYRGQAKAQLKRRIRSSLRDQS